MSKPLPIERLRQIADEIESLPETCKPWIMHDIPVIGGELIAETIDLGAFAGPTHTKLRSLIRRVKIQNPEGSGFDWRHSAWSEAVTCLISDVDGKPTYDWSAEATCRRIADTVRAEVDKIDAERPGPELTDLEKRIVRAVPKQRLTGAAIAKKIRDDCNGHFKAVLSGLVKRKILDNARDEHGKGYRALIEV